MSNGKKEEPSFLDYISDKWNKATESITEYIKGQSTWDEMREAGLPVAGNTDEQTAEALKDWITDPINLAFIGLGISSSWRYIANPKKLLSAVSKVNKVNQKKTAKLFAEREKIKASYVDDWDTRWIQKNMVHYVQNIKKGKHMQGSDEVINELAKVPIENLRSLPNHYFLKSKILREWINPYRREMIERAPWRYAGESGDQWRVTSGELRKIPKGQEVAADYEAQLISSGEVVKEYGAFNKKGQFIKDPAMSQKEHLKKLNVEAEKLKEFKDKDVFDLLKRP